jgi:hypothetical protein
MDRTEVLSLDATPSAVLDVVSDLATYPGWLDLVTRAEPVEGLEGDPGPAWDVELRGKVGPLARSKRLRMVRVEQATPEGPTPEGHGSVRFERREVGDRSRSPWVLTAEVAGDGTGCTLTMRLHYGGSLWGSVLDRVLADAVERGRSRLPQVISGG